MAGIMTNLVASIALAFQTNATSTTSTTNAASTTSTTSTASTTSIECLDYDGMRQTIQIDRQSSRVLLPCGHSIKKEHVSSTTLSLHDIQVFYGPEDRQELLAQQILAQQRPEGDQ